MLRCLFALCAVVFLVTACAGHWDPQSPHPRGASEAALAPAATSAPAATAPSATTAAAIPAAAPAASQLAAGDDYRLSVNDKVKVTVAGEADLSGEFAIDKAGVLTGPYVGQVQAKGMTVREFEQAYAAKLRKDEIMRDPRVSVEVTNLRPVYVLGEVKRPGQYAFVTGMTVQKAVAAAEGYTYLASESTVEITRGGTKVTVDLTSEPKLLPGDELRIPSRIF